jgi:hypothetical protein
LSVGKIDVGLGVVDFMRGKPKSAKRKRTNLNDMFPKSFGDALGPKRQIIDFVFNGVVQSGVQASGVMFGVGIGKEQPVTAGMRNGLM